MSDSTYEEAKRCPKCSQPGEVGPIYPAPEQARLPKGTTIHVVYCRNKLCTWFDTAWNVQVNPDGSVPPPKNHRGEPKLYAGVKDHDTLADRIVRGMQEQLRLEQEANDNGHRGYEIKNPFSR